MGQGTNKEDTVQMADLNRYAMDRHSADTLAWRFAEFRTQKNRLKSRFQYLLQKEEDGTSGRT